MLVFSFDISIKGSGCSTMAELVPHDLEFAGLNPARVYALILSFLEIK